MRRNVIIGVLATTTALLCVPLSLFSQVQPAPQPGDMLQADSLQPPRDTSVADSAQIVDTLLVADSLSAAEKALKVFEERRQQFEQERIRPAAYSLYDTLLQYYASVRFNRNDQLGQSIYNTAGDYFKFDPSYYSVEYQTNPMRTTVSPFGLRGNHIGILHNGLALKPFEHAVEPDGQVNFDDIPTAIDNDIFIIQGPAGAIFGADHSLTTLATRAVRPDEGIPETAILVDKGSFFYNYVRGRYSKRFVGGREIDMSIAYRNADGPTIRREDDAYTYYGRGLFPLSPDYAVRFSGYLYDRNGGFVVWPDVNNTTQTRSRIDRTLRTSIERYNQSHSRRHELGYTHLRQGSEINGNYSGRYHVTGNGFFLANEFYRGQSVWRVDADVNYTEYDFGLGSEKRWDGLARLRRIDLSEGWRYAIALSVGYAEDFDPLPSATLLLHRETDRSLAALSVGYSTRAPSQHELLLPFQVARVYGLGGNDYGEQGNPELLEEKQLAASLNWALGQPENQLSINVTGGQFTDAITWWGDTLTDSVGSRRQFAPGNNDLTFVSARIEKRITAADYLRFNAGYAYHYVDYKDRDDIPYSPEQQGFAGVELHVYWPQRIIHFWAYGEAVYTSSCLGYDQEGLGDEVITNVKLSFGMKRFRFHYVLENALNRVWQSREYLTRPGRYTYYGITWEFSY